MMSSENPFHDPARQYGQLQSPRKITSIVSPPKSSTGINKTLNLSDENPFHSIYGSYHYPSQVDPAKRITTQATTARSTENKSLNLSDDNPFHSSYKQYKYPSANEPQKRVTPTQNITVPLIPAHDLSDDNNPFTTYRPSLIREYTTNGIKNTSTAVTISTSIADWTRNNPVPLSYRPIQVQRPPSDYYNQSELSRRSSYVPPSSPPRPKQQLSFTSTPPLSVRTPSQPLKTNPSTPLEKTSLNMSPDNPFAEAYGRYHYPSAEEIKAKKRNSERTNLFTEHSSITDNRTTQSTNQTPTEYPETDKKDLNSAKGNNKFTRFDIVF